MYSKIIDTFSGLSRPTLVALFVGGPITAAAVHAVGMSGVFGTPESTGDAKISTAMSDVEHFNLMLAHVIFRIDGVISEEESAHLESASGRTPASVRTRIERLLQSSDIFVSIRNWFNALPASARDIVAEEVERLVRIDMERTEEEEAFLIQLAQIIEGNDRLELLLSCNGDVRKPELLKQNLFSYIDPAAFRTRYPGTDSTFHSGAIYTLHPYLTESLIPFGIDEFEAAQDRLFGGIFDLLKELGAKRVVVSELTEEKTTSKAEAGASGEYKNAAVGGGGSASLSSSSEQKASKIQNGEMRFDGSRQSIWDAFLPEKKQRHFLEKYRHNEQCCAIINARFGNNRASYFRYQVKSTGARKTAKAVNAAAKFDVKLVKASSSLKVQADGSFTSTVEKTLEVFFH